jgi:hypothetical protein
MRWNLRRGRKRIDACSTTEDVPRSTIRQKRTGDLKFLPRSSGRLENYDSSDLITAAKGSAQRSMSLGTTSPHVWTPRKAAYQVEKKYNPSDERPSHYHKFLAAKIAPSAIVDRSVSFERLHHLGSLKRFLI